MSKAIDITRLDLSPEELRKLAAKARDGRVVRRLLGSRLCWKGNRARRRRVRAEWTVKPCETGCTVIMPKAPPDCIRADHRGDHRS